MHYRLTHAASELSGFTCTNSLTMNERRPHAVLKISSSLLVNDRLRAVSSLSFPRVFLAFLRPSVELCTILSEFCARRISGTKTDYWQSK